MDALPTVTIAADALRDYVARIFVAAGTDAAEGERIGRYLVAANLAGHDSHGVIRVPRYVQNLHDGDTKAGQTISVVIDGPTHAVVDGNNGFGQTVAPQAVAFGIDKARKAGMAVVGLRNAAHIGRIGDWAEQAIDAGMVSIHFVNVAGGALVAPYGGVERRFSTNPFCIGVPLKGRPPLLLDMATSVVAEGKVLVASNGGKKVPPDSLIDTDGTISDDPSVLYGPIAGTMVRDAKAGTGALRAFGEHKGSAIAFMCEILAGALIGAATSSPIPEGRRRITNGMLSFYLQPEAFGGADRFAGMAAEYADHVKSSRPAVAGGEVLVPGEPEARTRAHRSAHGIPVQADTWAAIRASADPLGVTAPPLG